MKTYNELTDKQKVKALDKAVASLLAAIVEGAIKFNDKLNEDDLQARIDAACAKMERLRTPWFIGEAIMETCGDDIRGMAQCDAEDTLYLDDTERAVRL